MKIVIKALYAIKAIKLNIGMSLFLFLQGLILLSACIVETSAIDSRFTLYNEVRPFISESGFSANLYEMHDRETGYSFLRTSDAKDYLPGVTLHSSYNVYFSTMNKGKEIDLQTTAYDTALWKCHTPEMAAGRWFREEDEKTEEIEVVVAQVRAGSGQYRVGDTIAMGKEAAEFSGCASDPIKMKVIGIIEEGATILGCHSTEFSDNQQYNDIRRYFWNYFGGMEQCTYLFTNQTDIYNNKINHALSMHEQMQGLAFFSVVDGSKESLKEAETYLMENGSYTDKRNFRKVRKATKSYIIDQIMNIMPAFLILLFMSILTIISSNAISMRRNVHKYAVFYLTGLRWSDCYFIQICTLFFIEFSAFLASVIGLKTFQFAGILEDMYIKTGLVEIMCCMLLILVFLLISVLTSLQHISGNSAKKILFEER